MLDNLRKNFYELQSKDSSLPMSYEKIRKSRFWFSIHLSVKQIRRSRENLKAFVWKTKSKIFHFSASVNASHLIGNIFC